MVEPGRTLIPGTHGQGPTPWRVWLGTRPHHRDRGLPRRPQQQSPSPRLDRHRRIHPHQSRPRTRHPEQGNQIRDRPLGQPGDDPTPREAYKRLTRCLHHLAPRCNILQFMIRLLQYLRHWLGFGCAQESANLTSLQIREELHMSIYIIHGHILAACLIIQHNQRA